MDPIELAGEVNPLSRENLIRNLGLGASRSAGNHELQTATKQLQQWESQSAFYVQLQQVFIDQALPYEIRYLAILQLLHAVTNRQAWSRSSANSIRNADKSKIRSLLLVAGYREPDNRLAKQNALLTAKIVRSDFPREWPNVFDDLNATISSPFDWQNPEQLLQTRRALEFTQCIVKELAKASLRLAHLRSKAPELLGPVGEVFLGCSSRLQEGKSAGNCFTIDETNAISLLLPSTSIIRRLLVKGYQFPHRETDVVHAWTTLVQFFGSRAQSLQVGESSTPSVGALMLQKCLLQISKLHLEMVEDYPVAFMMLPHALDLVNVYWAVIKTVGQMYGSNPAGSATLGTGEDTTDGERPLIEKLALQGFLIVRACFKMLSDSKSVRYLHEQDYAEKDQVLRRLQGDLFTPAFVQELLEVIMNRFFVFRSSDLRRWEEEPDEWEAAEGADSEGFRYSLRLTAEKLFLDLSHKYKDVVVPGILRLVNSATTSEVPVAEKESTYTALGLAADTIHVYSQQQNALFDFNALLPRLVEDLQVQESSYRLIRRRIAILLGKWIHIQISKSSRPVVYQIFHHLLDNSQPLNDVVVRVTAGRQFKEVALDWEFDAQPFLVFAPDVLSRLMALIAEVELPETKMALLETISSLVENLGPNIAPFADHIVSILPSLWDESGDESLRKQVIITLLVRLFASMGSESIQYQQFALFIIKAVLNPQSTLPQLEREALLYDALDLWLATLENTASTSVDQLHPDLLELLKSALLPTLGFDTEARRAALELTSSYFLLIPKEFLSEQSFIAELLRSQAADLRRLKPEASAQVFRVAEQLVRIAEEFAGSDGIQIITNAMVESNFLNEMLLGLQESYEAHQTTGPKAKVSNIQGQVETDFFALLARIAYASPDHFLEVVESTGSGSVNGTIDWLFEEWFSHAQDTVSDPPRQKLMTMALSQLFTTCKPIILSRLQQLLDLWITVIESLTAGNDDKTVDSLVYPRQETVPAEGQSAGEVRKAALDATDAVHSTNLKDVIRRAVQLIIERTGGAERFEGEWLINVDKTIVQQFMALGIV